MRVCKFMHKFMHTYTRRHAHERVIVIGAAPDTQFHACSLTSSLSSISHVASPLPTNPTPEALWVLPEPHVSITLVIQPLYLTYLIPGPLISYCAKLLSSTIYLSTKIINI